MERRGCDEERRKIEERIRGMDESMNELRATATTLLSMEQRMERLEEMIKERLDEDVEGASDQRKAKVVDEVSNDAARSDSLEDNCRRKRLQNLILDYEKSRLLQLELDDHESDPSDNDESDEDEALTESASEESLIDEEDGTTDEDVSTSSDRAPARSLADFPVDRVSLTYFDLDTNKLLRRQKKHWQATLDFLEKMNTERMMKDSPEFQDELRQYVCLGFTWLQNLIDSHLLSLRLGKETLRDRFSAVPNMRLLLKWTDEVLRRSESAAAKFVPEMYKLMLVDAPYYCSFCGVLMRNHVQIVQHLTHSAHWRADETDMGLGSTMHWMTQKDLKRWDAADRKLKVEVARKYGRDPIERSKLRPTLEFLEDLEQAHSEELFAREEPEGTIMNAACRMLQESLGKKILTKLRKNVKDELTYCDSCGCITGKGEEYYSHLRTYEHIVKTPHRHIPTLVVNLLKPDLPEGAEALARKEKLRRATGAD